MLNALQDLPPEQKQAIVMAYFGSFSQSAIAQELGWPLGTVKNGFAWACRSCVTFWDSGREVETRRQEGIAGVVRPGGTLEFSNNEARPPQELYLGICCLRWALAVTTLLLVFALAWSIRLNVVLARERALRAEFVELVGQQQELVLEIVDSGKTTRRVLRSTSESSNAYGKVFTRSDMAYVVAMAARLPQPPPGQAYHLWLARGEATQLAGMLKINQEGFALVIDEAAQNDPIYTHAYVTLQPQDSVTPMGNPVIIWQAE